MKLGTLIRFKFNQNADSKPNRALLLQCRLVEWRAKNDKMFHNIHVLGKVFLHRDLGDDVDEHKSETGLPFLLYKLALCYFVIYPEVKLTQSLQTPSLIKMATLAYRWSTFVALLGCFFSPQRQFIGWPFFLERRVEGSEHADLSCMAFSRALVV